MSLLASDTVASSVYAATTTTTILGVVVVVVVAVLTCVRLWLERRLNSRLPVAGMPTLKDPHWLLGHFGLYQRSLPVGYRRALEASDDRGRLGLWILHWPVVMLFDAVEARRILRAEHRHSTNFVLEKHFNMLFGEYNLGFLNDKLWKKERDVVHRALATSDALTTSRRVVHRVARTLIASIRQRIQETEASSSADPSCRGYYHADNVETLMKMITLDVFGRVCFSCDLRSCANLRNPPLAECFSLLGADFSRRIRTNPAAPHNWFYAWPNQANRRCAAARRVLSDFLHERLSERTSPSEEDDDVLAALLKSHGEMRRRGETGDIPVDALLRDVVLSLLFAGYDTTSIALTYCLYLISQHPDVERRCLDEITGVDFDHDDDDARSLVYCRAVVQEAIRLYPPAFVTLRHLQKDITLSDGFVMRAGTNVSFPIWAMHRAERNFTRATEFLPARWVTHRDGTWQWRNHREETDDDDDNPIPAADPECFVGFSAGSRNCPGQHFAMQEATLVLAHLLRAFTFECPEDYVLRPDRNGVVQHPVDGVPMTIRLRTPPS